MAPGRRDIRLRMGTRVSTDPGPSDAPRNIHQWYLAKRARAVRSSHLRAKKRARAALDSAVGLVVL
eukprot:3605864-Lingulodinium_polyedra.AAC.1